MGEEVQVSGRPEQGQGAAEREGGGEEGGPERCPQETEEEAEALVTQPPLTVQEQPPQLQVGKGEERGVEQGVQDAQRQLHGARHRGASAAPAGRGGLAAGRRTRHGRPHEGARGRAKERGKQGAGLGAAVEGEKDVSLTPHPPQPPTPGSAVTGPGAPRRAAAAPGTPPPLPAPPPGGSRLLLLRLGSVAAKNNSRLETIS